MRIASGILKGKYIKPLKGMRPTQDKVRSAIFDILGQAISDASFCELYAGTGAVGFEALSRGAKKVCFVEQNPACFKAIKVFLDSNAEILQNKDINLFRADALKAIERFSQNNEKFDIIFADPPFFKQENKRKKTFLKLQWAKKTLQSLGRYDIISPSGMVIIQTASSEFLESFYTTFSLAKSYSYGDTKLWLFQRS